MLPCLFEVTSTRTTAPVVAPNVALFTTQFGKEYGS